ncbi:MAG: ATP-binding protein [Pyrinomonadaceae bacterium]|nr:ATP-binding protein [Pyrinomonadaceae bacterium]MCX7640437.1 ATP-binding protein [Pyrinomonadaceae bacterium]MDW8304864.1 ATP-binding protein [Acidobacteriota bacterium]
MLVVETAADILLLYALSSLNFVAFVIFVFIFIRNLLKLLRERKDLQLGSKIKTRLLIYFFAVSLMPTIAMAVFSYLFMNRAIERWFTNIPENVVRRAYQMQEDVNRERLSSLVNLAQFLVFVLEREDITDEKLAEIARKAGFSRIVVLSKENKIISSSAPLQDERLDVALEGELFQMDQGKFVVRADFSDGKKLLAFSDAVSEWRSDKMAERALEEFDKLKAQQITVRQIGLSTLGLLTLLLIFASGWIAFHLARGLTEPIKALAEGANEIASGNFSHRVNVLAEDELAILVASFNQMAERLQANATELQRRKNYIETVLESLSAGVISVDAENRLTTINKAAKKILKLENADFSGMKLFSLIQKENLPVFEKILTRAKRIGIASEQITLYRFSDSQGSDSIPVALTATALPEESGIVIVMEDLTELIAAQRLAAWSEVARRMAHEIKNPLTPIQLSAERIAKRFQLELEQRNNLEHLKKVVKEGTQIILSEVKSLKSMVDEFSKFARLPSAKLEQKNLNEIIKRAVLLYEDRADVDIKLLLGDIPDCMLDEQQIKQALVNLIDNAIEAFEMSQLEKQIIIKTFVDRKVSKIVLEVSDNASGIDPKLFPKLFQPYFSTKDKGTGLGLTIVNRIVVEHGGKISVHKNLPQGTRFRIELPLIS